MRMPFTLMATPSHPFPPPSSEEPEPEPEPERRPEEESSPVSDSLLVLGLLDENDLNNGRRRIGCNGGISSSSSRSRSSRSMKKKEATISKRSHDENKENGGKKPSPMS